MRLVGIVNQLATLGDPEPDDKVVLKYLWITRPRYKQLVLSIETLHDISTLSLEEVIGRLKVAEDGNGESSIMEGKLLTEEEWVERSKKKDFSDGSHGGSSVSNHGGQVRGGGNHERGRGHGGRGDDSSSSGGRGNDNFHRCGKQGH
jgi:hypothetical protein